MREEFLYYVFEKMVAAKVVSLVDEDDIEDFADRVNKAKELKFGSVKRCRSISGTAIDKYAKKFRVLEKQIEFEELFNRYALACLIQEKARGLDIDKRVFKDRANLFLKYKLDKIVVEKEAEPVQFSEILAQATSVLNQHTSDECVYYARKKKKGAGESGLYLIAAVVESMLNGIEFKDQDTPIVQLAGKIVSSSQLKSKCEFREILSVVETYIVKHLSEIDGFIIQNYIKLLLLPEPANTKDCYENFKRNILTYARPLSDGVMKSALRKYKDLIVDIIVKEFSAEDIAAAFKAYGSFDEIKPILEQVCYSLTQMHLKDSEQLERAKVLGQAIITHGKLSFLFASFSKDIALDRMLSLIKIGVLDASKMSIEDLSSIAEQVNNRMKEIKFEENENFFNAVLERMDFFINEKPSGSSYKEVYKYRNLVEAMIREYPELLATHYVEYPWITIEFYGRHLIKNKQYLNKKIIDSRSKDDADIFSLFKLQSYPKDAIEMLSFNAFKILVNVTFKNCLNIAIYSPVYIETFREKPLLINFRAALRKNFEACKAERDYEFMLTLYMMCMPDHEDKELKEDIEKELISARENDVKSMLRLNHKFFQKLPIHEAARLIKAFSDRDKFWVEGILSNEYEYILSHSELREALITYMKTTQSYINDMPFYIFSMLPPDARCRFKDGLPILIRSFDNDLKKYERLPGLRDFILKTFTAKELLELGAINLIHYQSGRNPTYINGECKGQILYEFLCKGLPTTVVGDDVKILVGYIKNAITIGGANEKVKNFVLENNDAFIEAGVDVCILYERKWANTQNAEVAKRKEIDAKEKTVLLENKLKAEGKAILIQTQEQDLNISIAKTNAEAAKLKLKTQEINKIRLLSVDDIYRAYSFKHDDFDYYQHLTDEQKVGLILKIYGGNSHIENLGIKVSDDTYKQAILKAEPDSTALCKMLAPVDNPELIKYALKNFKLSYTGVTYIRTQEIEGMIEGDKDLQLRFFQGPKNPKAMLWYDGLLLAAFTGAYFMSSYVWRQIDLKYICGAAIPLLLCNTMPCVNDYVSYAKIRLDSLPVSTWQDRSKVGNDDRDIAKTV